MIGRIVAALSREFHYPMMFLAGLAAAGALVGVAAVGCGTVCLWRKIGIQSRREEPES